MQKVKLIQDVRAVKSKKELASLIKAQRISERVLADAVKKLKDGDTELEIANYIKKSFAKVGADKVWATIITKYNSVPMVKKVNPDLTDYTTNKSMEGVFKMIAVEEKDIRNNLSARSSDLLKKVFALQDGKQG